MPEPRGVKVTRFKRGAYLGGNSSGDEPRWHIAVSDYEKGEIYNRMRALCGYTLTLRSQIRGGVEVSKAVRPPKGEQCKKCIREREKAADA